jgi:hypothetical protein
MPHTLNTCLSLKRGLEPTLRAGVAIALGLACALSQAASVSYQATNLADVVAGQDLWQLDYTITGPFSKDESIDLLFNPELYTSIQLASISPADSLDPLSSQPDPQLVTDGQLLLTSLAERPVAFKANVTVRFVWLGQAAPGSQPFQWLDNSFNPIANGQTSLTSPVPESACLPLALTGLGVAWGVTAVRRRACSLRARHH